MRMSTYKCLCLFVLLNCNRGVQCQQSELTANVTYPSSGPAQHYVCNKGYSPLQCHQQMLILHAALASYPSANLGEWTWVLVRSNDWDPIIRKAELDPDTPAFTVLERRTTFFEEALVAPVPGRRSELIRYWGRNIDDLLTLAVTHELGHSLCNERNERKADAYGQRIRERSSLVCKS